MNTVLLISMILVFGTCVLFLGGVYLLWNEFHEAGAEKLKRRIRLLSAAAVDESKAEKQFSLSKESLHSPLDKALLSLPRVHHMDRFLEQAGVQFGPVGYLALSLAAGMVGVVIFIIFFRSLSLLPIVLGFTAGALVLWFRLNRRRRLRLDRINKQLPDAMDFIARALRAGSPFIGGLKSASDEIPSPLGDELMITFEEMNYGLDFEEAMRNLAARVGTEEVRFFITAVMVQKSTGGNLAEILNRISALLRDRTRTEGEVRIQAAEMRLSARILILLPFIVAGALQILNPEYLPILLDTNVGKTIIVIQLVLMAIGYAIMKRMIRFRI